MENKSVTLTIKTTLYAPIDKVWQCWTQPEHINHWYFASEDWHAPHAENDLRVGGKFLTRMEAKDGSFGFDYEGIYNAIREYEYIEYCLADDRKVKITFSQNGTHTTITESFDTETENSVELQQQGWQAILDNFKKYVENIG